MKKLLMMLMAALAIGGCSDTGAGKPEQDADAAQTGTETQATGAKGGAFEAGGPENDQTSDAGSEGTGTQEPEQQEKAPDKRLPLLDTTKLENTYGFADKTGKYILSFENMDVADLDKAIGKDGRPLNIKFVKKQPQGSRDDGSQSANNFNNVQGLLYEVVGGNAQPNETYYLVNSDNFNVASLLQVKPEVKEGADVAVKKKIEETKAQKIDKIWKMASIAPERDVYLVQFQKQGKKITASLVLVEGEGIASKDFTADYDPISTWRVDDGGEIVPEMFSFLFAASSPEGIVLGVAWAGAEGENGYIFKQSGNELVDLNITAGRYMSY